MAKIIAFFMAIITFFANLFGINIGGGNTNNPTVTNKDGITFVQNIRYGEREREVLDLAYPQNASGNVDLILDVHGGAWIAGSKDNETNFVKAFAQNGYVGAAISYTYISENTHCDLILDEITAALKTIVANCADAGITINKYIIMGASAGGHLATLYAYSRGSEAGIAPAAVFDLCGPVALEYLSVMPEMVTSGSLGSTEQACTLISNLCGVKVTLDNLGTPEVKAALQAVSATHFIDNAVPTVIMHGLKDNIVPYANAVILDEKLTEAGVRHDLIPFPNSGHGLSDDPDCTSASYALWIQYAADYLTKAK